LVNLHNDNVGLSVKIRGSHINFMAHPLDY